MDQDIFQEISQKDILDLLIIYKCDLKNYYPLGQYVEIMEEYKKASITNPRQSLYRFGNQIEDGIYLFEAHFDLGDTSYTLFHVFTASKDLSKLEEALVKTKRITWFDSNYVFQTTLKIFCPIVRKVAEDKGVKLNRTEEDLLWLPPSQSLQVSKVPDDLDLKFLDCSHAELMNKSWKSKFNGSSKYMEIQISNNFGLGLFRKSDSNMVCSALSYNNGGIFVLQTDPENRGKGYAEIIVRSMANELRSRQKVPFACVRRDNIASQKVFRKIGFTDFSLMEFISPPNYYTEYIPITTAEKNS